MLASLAPALGAGAVARLGGVISAQSPRVQSSTNTATVARQRRGVTHTGTDPCPTTLGSRPADVSTMLPTASTPPRSCATSNGAAPRGWRAAASCASGSWSLWTGRSRSRPASSSRPGPTTGASRPRRFAPRGRAAADPVRQRLRASAHDPLPRHPSGGDGRPARSGPGVSRPGKSVTYEFDAEPFGLHLYHCHVPPARRAHRAAACTARSSSIPRGARPPPTSWSW